MDRRECGSRESAAGHRTAAQEAAANGPLDLTLLRTFLAVHRAGSFTAAARLLGLSQPTVTTQIRVPGTAVGPRTVRPAAPWRHPDPGRRRACRPDRGTAGRPRRRRRPRTPRRECPGRSRAPRRPRRTALRQGTARTRATDRAGGTAAHHDGSHRRAARRTPLRPPRPGDLHPSPTRPHPGRRTADGRGVRAGRLTPVGGAHRRGQGRARGARSAGRRPPRDVRGRPAHRPSLLASCLRHPADRTCRTHRPRSARGCSRPSPRGPG